MFWIIITTTHADRFVNYGGRNQNNYIELLNLIVAISKYNNLLSNYRLQHF